MGTVWDRVGSYGIVWDRMRPYGHLWNRMGTVWALIEPYGHLWEGRTKHRMGPYDRMGTLTLWAP